jgi:anti-sigma-K factor RskA
MEKEALILRARAELAKLDAEYANSDDERRVLAERARAYEAQARELEESLAGWRL